MFGFQLNYATPVKSLLSVGSGARGDNPTKKHLLVNFLVQIIIPEIPKGGNLIIRK
jgi:hypothetical protein